MQQLKKLEIKSKTVKSKQLYKFRLTMAGVIFTLAVLGILGIFYPVRIYNIQFLPIIQRVITDFSIIAVVLFVFVIGLTFLFGRIYCSVICPFGIVQEIAGFIRNQIYKSKGKPKRAGNFPLKYFIAAIAWGVFFGGSTVVIRYIDPSSLFGSAATLSTVGIIAAILIVIAVILQDRIFCTNFCPVGTVLGLISKISPNKIYMNEDCVSCGMCEKNCPSGCINSKEKNVENETCIKCLKCINICPKNSMQYGIKPKSSTKFSLKRRQIIIAGAALVLFGGMIKAGIELKDKIVEKIKDVILPPGAGDKERFLNKCLNCNLCINNCPNKIIKKADAEYQAVHLDYSKGFCKFDCNECSKVCPSGAIKKISLDEKQKTRIAMAMIKDDVCTNCGECANICPVHAIIRENGKPPVLDASKCIGCGACKNTCYFGAIDIFEIKEQKIL